MGTDGIGTLIHHLRNDFTKHKDYLSVTAHRRQTNVSCPGLQGRASRTPTSPLQWERLFSWADATHSCRDPPVARLAHSKEKPSECPACSSFWGGDQMASR